MTALDTKEAPQPTNPNEEKEKLVEAVKEPETTATKPEKRLGFAGMDHATVREIARRGGLAAHRKGAAHQFTSDEAREAGRKGGLAHHRSRGRAKSEDNGAAR